MAKVWNVTFCYTIDVRAEDEDEAEEKAAEIFHEDYYVIRSSDFAMSDAEFVEEVGEDD